ILVDEPSPEETIEIINGIRANYEKHHNVVISPEAVKTAVELSVRYLPDRFLPDKALDLIDESAANLKTKNERSPKIKLLNAIEKELEAVSAEKTKAVLSQDFDAAQTLRYQEYKLKKQRDEYKESMLNADSTTRLEITPA